MDAAEERKKLLAEVKDWDVIHKRVVAYALLTTKSKPMALELAQEAILRAYDPQQNPWDREKHPDIAIFLFGIVRRMVSNVWASARHHRELLVDFRSKNDDSDDRWRDKDQPTPEDEVAHEDFKERRRALLRVRLAKKPIPLRLLELIEDGVERPKEQAEALGLSIEEIRNARKVLFRYIDAVVQDMPEDGEFDSGEQDGGRDDERDDLSGSEVLQ